MVSHLSPPQRGRRGIFVLWRLRRKKNSACLFPLPIASRALSIFSIIAIFIGILSGSLCGGERFHMTCGGHIGVPNKCCGS